MARGISVVEDERDGFQDFLHAVLLNSQQAEQGRAARVGLTGPPGAGKSSLVAQIATAYRADGEEVGVVAVDPTSPFSGGALLGDRIRMNDLATDSGIFIRSMASRGSLGGLATTTKEVIDLMDAFGFPRILVETVGVGQTQLEVTAATDTVVVVLVPESGDAIQAMKAGLMEIADIFVINKADRPGADRLLTEIRQAIHLKAGQALRQVPAHHGVDLSSSPGAPGPSPTAPEVGAPRRRARRWEPPERWRIPVLKTVAQDGDGVPELLKAIDRHRAHLVESGELESRRRVRAGRRIRDVVERQLRRVVWGSEDVARQMAEGLDRIGAGDDTPYSVALAMSEEILSGRLDP